MESLGRKVFLFHNIKMGSNHTHHHHSPSEKEHGHSHGHHHHHHDIEGVSQRKLYWAVAINVLLTVVQFVAGAISGSLSLVADAIHNLSDAGAIILAAFANRISQLPADRKMTFGYRRAQILGALINSSTLVLVAIYLIYESWNRFFDPQPIDGWIVIYVASVALVIDLFTAFLMYSGSKSSINIRAAFIHNVSDALASVVVIISGVLIILFQQYWVDLVATILISIYILYHSYFLLKKCVQILMQSVPEELDMPAIEAAVKSVTQVKDIHHVHLWQLDDRRYFFEAHVQIEPDHLHQIEGIKKSIKTLLKEKFSITHSTLEFEVTDACATDAGPTDQS